jgi:hypothetical protein
MLMAKMKRINGAIKKIRVTLQNPALTDDQFNQLMSNLHGLANQNAKSAHEAITLTGNTRKRVDKYARSL